MLYRSIGEAQQRHAADMGETVDREVFDQRLGAQAKVDREHPQFVDDRLQLLPGIGRRGDENFLDGQLAEAAYQIIRVAAKVEESADRDAAVAGLPQLRDQP